MRFLSIYTGTMKKQNKQLSTNKFLFQVSRKGARETVIILLWETDPGKVNTLRDYRVTVNTCLLTCPSESNSVKLTVSYYVLPPGGKA